MQQQSDKEITQLRSINISFEPGAGARFSRLPLQPTLTAGYQFGLVQRPLHLKGDRDSKMNLNGENVITDFSGFRLGMIFNLYQR